MRKSENQKIREPENHWEEEIPFPPCSSAPLLPCRRRGGWGLPVCSSAGYVLPVVLIVAFMLTVSGTAFLSVYTGQSKNMTLRINQEKALYFAEAGIRKAIWRVNHRYMEEWEQWAKFSETDSTSFSETDTTICVTYVDSTKTLTSVGNVGDKADTIVVKVLLDTATDHVVSFTGGFDTLGTAGYLDAPEDNMPAQFDALPIVDLDYYRNIANFVYGQPDSLVEQTFNSTLADGIYFVYGNVIVKNPAVLNGTILAIGGINFQGQVTISAQQVPADSSHYPAYYPAIMACGDSLSDITGGNTNLTINGMVYSTGECAMDPVSVNGPIIASNIELAGSYTVSYDTLYTLSPPGFSWPPGSFVATIGSWSN